MALPEEYVLSELREIRREMREDSKETREAMGDLRGDLTDTRDCVHSAVERITKLESRRFSSAPPAEGGPSRTAKAKTLAITIGGAGGLGTALVWIVKQLTGS